MQQLNELIDQVLNLNDKLIVNIMIDCKDSQFYQSNFANNLYSDISFKNIADQIIQLLGIKRHQLRKDKRVKKVFLDRFNKKYFSVYPF